MIEQLSFAFAELAPTQIVDFYPNFLSQSEGDELFAASQDLQWQQNEIRIFGKPIANPRLEAIYGDEGCDYSYSGILLSVSPWVDCLRELRDRIESFTGYRYHIAIGNRYRNGKDSIGWHADKQPSLGVNPAIASISLGATRKFSVKPRSEGETQHFELAHGSLILMRPGCQTTHVHQVPKQLKVTGERINWTFRPHVNSRFVR